MKQNKHRILIVDDDPDDRLLIKEALLECSQEIEIDTVSEGSELLEYLCGRIGCGLPDLILMDIRMPKRDGLEVLREIKTHNRLGGIPVVILTGFARDVDVTRAYESGANTVIQKPDSLEELFYIMRGVYNYWLRVSLGKPPVIKG